MVGQYHTSLISQAWIIVQIEIFQHFVYEDFKLSMKISSVIIDSVKMAAVLIFNHVY